MQPFELDDEMLMVRYREGDPAAFDELYRRHAPRLYGYLRQRRMQPGEAEDLLQTCFLKVHRYRDRYDATLPFLPWFFSIARGALIDYVRRKKTVSVDPAVLDATVAAEGHASEEEAAGRWHEVLRLLPEGQRKLLEMRFAEGQSFEEIGASEGINEVAARKRVSRALQKVRDLFGGAAEAKARKS